MHTRVSHVRPRRHENLKNPTTYLGDPTANSPTTLRVDVRVPAEAFPLTPPPPPPPPPKWHTAPLPPPAGAWLGLCGRVTSIGHNQNMGGVFAGVCLQINATAPAGLVGWRLELNGTEILASGVLPGVPASATETAATAASITAWHTLELAFDCTTVRARVDPCVRLGGRVFASTGTGAHVQTW